MKNLALPDNHAFFAYEKDIQTIVSPQLLSHKVKFFDFCRLFNDGRIYFLSSQSNVVQYIFSSQCAAIGPAPQKYINDKKFRYLLKEEGVYSKAIHEVREQFGLENFINFVEREKDYVDIFCFGGQTKDVEVLDYYLNHLDDLEKVIQVFKEQSSGMMKQVTPHAVKLPDHMMPNLCHSVSAELNSEHLPLILSSGDNQQVSLSRREMHVLQLLVRGQSAKQIAQVLGVSPRTVEHHIESMKHKTHTKTKFLLIEFALKNRFI